MMNQPRRLQNCCSFCGIAGHNIRRCNSQLLLEFESWCASQVMNTETKSDFKNCLTHTFRDNMDILKAFAIKKIHIAMRTNIVTCVDLIVDYTFIHYKNTTTTTQIEENQNVENELEGDLIDFLEQLRYTENVNEEGRENIRETILESQEIEFIRNLFMYANNNKKFGIYSSVESDEKNEKNDFTECGICLEERNFNKFIKLGCNHEFCKDCMIKSFRSEKRDHICCALCRCKIQYIKSRTNEVHEELSEFIE